MGAGLNLHKLKTAGVEVALFGPILHMPFKGNTNLRNHRKMVVADGARLWCGGRNFAAEYFEGLNRRAPWRDLSSTWKSACGAGARIVRARLGRVRQTRRRRRRRGSRAGCTECRGGVRASDRVGSRSGGRYGARSVGHRMFQGEAPYYGGNAYSCGRYAANGAHACGTARRERGSGPARDRTIAWQISRATARSGILATPAPKYGCCRT